MALKLLHTKQIRILGNEKIMGLSPIKNLQKPTKMIRILIY